MALGKLDGNRVEIVAAQLGRSGEHLLETLETWLRAADQALIAIDAPLGWPKEMGSSLSGHVAGQPITVAAEYMFRRDTDRYIRKSLGKQSLDVGADRIARTAFAALALLEGLRKRTGCSIPLAWSRPLQEHSAIEVYPAATLRAHGVSDQGYKDKEQIEARVKILGGLGSYLSLRVPTDELLASADVLDAVICVLAGMDFLVGVSMAPQDLECAKREGWIWSRGR